MGSNAFLFFFSLFSLCCWILSELFFNNWSCFNNFSLTETEEAQNGRFCKEMSIRRLCDICFSVMKQTEVVELFVLYQVMKIWTQKSQWWEDHVQPSIKQIHLWIILFTKAQHKGQNWVTSDTNQHLSMIQTDGTSNACPDQPGMEAAREKKWPLQK